MSISLRYAGMCAVSCSDRAASIQRGRFGDSGYDVVEAEARFSDRQISAGDDMIRARRIVIATGSEPAIPPIPGSTPCPISQTRRYSTIDVLPDDLVIIGAGAVGIELAQAFRRLGAAVTWSRPAAQFRKTIRNSLGMLLRSLDRRRVSIHTANRPTSNRSRRPRPASRSMSSTNGRQLRIEGSHLLSRRDASRGSTGSASNRRHPYDRSGITVDRRLRTDRPRGSSRSAMRSMRRI